MSDRFPYLRLRWKLLGGHVHCRLFTSPTPDGTWAKCGDLVFSEKEWDGVRIALNSCEILPEEQ